jgi:adenosylhomocysteine nucleosidase
MPIGVVVGLAFEAHLARRLGWPVAIGGGTSDGATQAAQRLVDAGATALLSLGIAGALDPSLRPGAVLIPATVVSGTQRHSANRVLAERLGGTTWHIIVGADAVVPTPQQKARLREQTGAAALDMESGAVARVAAASGLPFAVLRVICDPAERTLPPAALIAPDAHGSIRVRRVCHSLIVQPGQLPALIALAIDAAKARRALATHIRRLARSPAPPA